MLCLSCSEAIVQDTFGSVRPTICCYDCCKKFRGDYDGVANGMRLCSRLLARLGWGCSKKDLAYLDSLSIVTQEPFYLSAEVELVARLRAGDPKAMHNERRTLNERKQYLEAAMGVPLSSIDPVMRFFLLEDYLRKSFDCKTTLEDVLQRFSLLGRVEAICALYIGAYPPAAFSFCLRVPAEDNITYEDFVERGHRVFDLVGHRILSYLSVVARNKLAETNLGDTLLFFYARDSETLVRLYLEGAVGSEAATEILEAPHSRRRIDFSRGREEKCAETLIELWRREKDESETERELLQLSREFGYDHDGYAQAVRYCLNIGRVLVEAEIRSIFVIANKLKSRVSGPSWLHICFPCAVFFVKYMLGQNLDLEKAIELALWLNDCDITV